MFQHRLAVLCMPVAFVFSTMAFAAENPFMGSWALTPTTGGAGWLEVKQAEGYLDGTLLWMGGSPEPQTRVWMDGDNLCMLRVWNEEVRDAAGKVMRTVTHPVSLTATLTGDALHGFLSQPSNDGTGVWKDEFTGMRTPPLPPKPDLSKLRFGDSIALIDGRDLEGWAVIGGAHWSTLGLKKPDGSAAQGWVPKDESVANGWSVRGNVLANDPVQKEGQPYIRYGNLQTIQDFEDFNLTTEVNVPPNGNSGIYLRGIYEIQVIDSFGKPPDCHNMGAVYGRITPIVAAEKPAGEWQTLDITLVDRHATVKLNDQTIIDNQPIAGCTGGALWSDQMRPGPIYLQGDHTAVQYRNMVLRPVLKWASGGLRGSLGQTAWDALKANMATIRYGPQ